VHLARDEAAVDVPVLDRGALREGTTFDGPALVDAGDTTIWIGRGARARVDDAGALVVIKEP
jgi:N-methylhydantoinase A/oxoprolinase/acetone carboxylase beta subunit